MSNRGASESLEPMLTCAALVAVSGALRDVGVVGDEVVPRSAPISPRSSSRSTPMAILTSLKWPDSCPTCCPAWRGRRPSRARPSSWQGQHRNRHEGTRRSLWSPGKSSPWFLHVGDLRAGYGGGEWGTPCQEWHLDTRL